MRSAIRIVLGVALAVSVLPAPAHAVLLKSAVVCDVNGDLVVGGEGDGEKGQVTIGPTGTLKFSMKGLPAGQSFGCDLLCLGGGGGGSTENCGTTDANGRATAVQKDFVDPEGLSLGPVFAATSDDFQCVGGCGTGPACFTGDTAVTTATGPRRIQEIRTGDLVWARDEATGQQALQPVVRTMRRLVPALRVVDLGLITIRTTDEHPFWVEGRGWTMAGELKAGDTLRTRKGELVPIVATTRREEPTVVYNLTVDGFHTFFVSEADVLVHNK
jgi:hypothetical protein